MNTAILQRKKAALCVMAALLFVSLFVIINSGEKIKENTGGYYAVKIRHYGIDAAEMERSVTIPLEDALFAIAGTASVQSSSENGLSSVYIRFKNKTGALQGGYEAVRDAAQRVYETLPSSVQRPEILSSGNSRIPVWSAAVLADDAGNTASLSELLEKTVKPRLESLEGAGEVVVSGAGLKEIFIILDQEKCVSLGLEPSAAASYLAANDSVFSAGKITNENREIIVTVDGRNLEGALIPLGEGKEGKYAALSDIAVITERERAPDILSRLNGRKTAGVAIMGRDGADLRKLSSGIKKELAALSLPLDFIVLSDLGAEEAAAFRSVFNAALLGAIMVALVVFLLGGKKAPVSSGLFCALSIPLICLVSAAILSAAGFAVNRLTLAGIAAGIGTAVDAVILCSEKLRRSQRSRRISYADAACALSELKNPLLAGAATTVAALIPLFAVEEGGVKIIASAVSVVTITALVISLFLLPPLLLWRRDLPQRQPPQKSSKSPQKPQFFAHISRFLHRFLASNVRFCTRRPAIVLAASLTLTAAAVLALFSRGVDTAGYGSEDSVYAQIEFDGGLLAEEIDRLLSVYGENLADNAGILNVETGARTGSASLLISFDPAQIKAHRVRELAKSIPVDGGFVFFHESQAKERYWEIKIYGDSEEICRKIAEDFAYVCAGNQLIKDLVLNFKTGSKKLVLTPDRHLFAKAGISFSAAAAKLRLGVFGPVAYKRTDGRGETDVRIATGTSGGSGLYKSKEEALGVLVSTLRADTLMHVKEKTEPSSLRRDNRRSTASVTITTKRADPRRIRENILPLFEKLDLPPGYSLEFDPDAIKASEALSATIFSLVIAIVFCYMIIASINESFLIPLIVLSAIPPSLAIPALVLALSGGAYTPAAACAFIAVSGMTVNAAVLCADGIRLSKNIYPALRKKLPALLATTGTTVAGAIPFLFLKEGANAMIKTLSLVGAMGVAASCICSITLIPSLFTILKKHIPRMRDKNHDLGNQNEK
jgi:multidrug efflux pump subunit AcrB